ncbi:Sensory transduction protein LytR [Neolewinella maritima]|uniref:Sensory transduction protein LytR n=1 Tax=Neolewinella maritima TaxID=1383882 RepID=A0ABN8F8H2_9BACT|nr:response regulator transcription factor [Neolewinella maritima]CAH1001872.1 Sensory transduction protein LytR [Neolewinella maritima]
MITTLIVDDEPLARSGLSEFVSRVDFLIEVGQCRNGLEALSFLEQPVDLLLLDVQMPGLSGTELVRSLSVPPAVIFTTAHPGFAVEGFELEAVDYLLKPISFPRFLRAVLKVKNYAPAAPPTVPTATPEDIFIREDGRVTRIRVADILYAEAMQNYCRITTTSASYLTLLPLSQLLESLPVDAFVQIHRSYLVHIDAVDGIAGHQVRIGEKLLPISRSNRDSVLRRLLGDRLL